MNAGRDLQQLSACFVLPVEDSMEAIFDAIRTRPDSQEWWGYRVSFPDSGQERPGPFYWWGKRPGLLHESLQRCHQRCQAGRYGAEPIWVYFVDHPDILEFIRARRQRRADHFNISVALTEDFMNAVEDDEEYDLINPRTGEITGSLRAREVFDLIVDSAWRNGEPGIVFIDRINDANPTPKLGEIESTNPCGEQPLLPNESCNLGSINLSRMLKRVKRL